MKRANAPMYDLFKAVVAVILAVILILMLLRGCAVNTPAAAPQQTATDPVPTEPAAAPTQVTLPAEATRTPTASPVPTTAEPTSAPTTAVTETPTATPGPETAAPAPGTACNTSVPSRLSVGGTALVVRRLNMRSEASIEAAILRTNAVNTRVEIVGGPVCTPVGNRAYLWWQIRLPDGSEGWSAESPLNEAGYFLEPAS